jgi:hypothetical protein
MLIKPKSLVVALASSFVIALVLIMTVASYIFYVEIKGREFDAYYQKRLAEIKAAGQRVRP